MKKILFIIMLMLSAIFSRSEVKAVDFLLSGYSIITDHLGTPVEGYDDAGTLIWERELDTNGKTRMLKGDEGFCNFTFQGQEYDKDIELSYNHFRWFSAEDGRYISQDPIGLASGEYNFYAYVEDTNTWVDVFGLGKSHYSGKRGINKAKYDLKRNGFIIMEEELTMRVNRKRIRADIVAKDGNGNIHVFEVKHGKGALSKNQAGSGVFDSPSVTPSA